jgi:hypothetical protein
VSQTTTTEKRQFTREEAVAELRRLRAEIAEANPDLTDEDWDALAERWTADVNAALADHVRESRGEPKRSRPECA